ncbi:MAG: hypothetical protein ACLTW9_23405 [Enterocloster sp.]
MAYFDSPKNRVKWEIELEELRQQKEDFAAGRLHDTGEIKRRHGGGTAQKTCYL